MSGGGSRMYFERKIDKFLLEWSKQKATSRYCYVGHAK